MKKRFWTRLVSAVLTMAMAFSILAVPASAASTEWWAVGISMGEIEDALMWSVVNSEQKKQMGESVITSRRVGDAFKNAVDGYVGLSWSADGRVFWYSGEELAKLNEDAEIIAAAKKGEFEFDNERGTAVFKTSSGEVRISPKVILEAPTVKPDTETPATSDGSGGSADGDAVMIIAVAGAAAAAATGVYFYTHPEKWQEVKDYFADLSANVQAKFQEFTDGVKSALGIPTEEAETAETAETAENAAVPQDAAA